MIMPAIIDIPAPILVTETKTVSASKLAGKITTLRTDLKKPHNHVKIKKSINTLRKKTAAAPIRP